MRGEEEEQGKGGRAGRGRRAGKGGKKWEGGEKSGKIGRRGGKRMIECSIMLATYTISLFSHSFLSLFLFSFTSYYHTYLVGSWDMAGPG